MDIKNEIQHQIDINGGSKNRVITRTMEKYRCSEDKVCACIDWLLKNKFIEEIECSNMNEDERRYYRSDECVILRNCKTYNEITYYEEEKKRIEYEDTLSTKEKFELYFSRMEEEFERKSIFNDKNYTIKYAKNKVTLSLDDGEREVLIEFEKISNLYYDASNNCVFYNLNNKYYSIDLYYCWGKCCLRHYNGL